MVIRYSQIVHSPVFTLDSQQKIATVVDVVLNKTEFSIKALLVRTIPIIPLNKNIPFFDIVELVSNAVLVRDENAIADMNQSVRIKEAIKEKLYGINHRVFTKSNKFIGFVYDYTIHSESGKITKMYVKNLFSDRIISTEKIIKFIGKKIIIGDDFQLISNLKTQTEAKTA